jgi:uncharacterized protein (UPF0335 family)
MNAVLKEFLMQPSLEERVGRLEEKVDSIQTDVKDLKSDVRRIEGTMRDGFARQDAKIAALDVKVATLDGNMREGFARLEGKISAGRWVERVCWIVIAAAVTYALTRGVHLT